MADHRGPLQRGLRVLLCTVVVGASAAALAQAVGNTSAQTRELTSPGVSATRQLQYSLMSCLEDQFDAAVPQGGRVYIVNGGAEYYQRMAEFSSGRAAVSVWPLDARYMVIPAQANPGCPAGLGFRVVPLG